MDPITQRNNDDAWQRAQSLASSGGTAPAATPQTGSTTTARPAARAVDLQPPLVATGDPIPKRFLEAAAAPTPLGLQRDARDVETQRRLDSFFAMAAAPYRTPDGGSVSVTPPFKMGAGYPDEKKTTQAHAGDLAAAAARAHIDGDTLSRIEMSRGTPAEVHALTQALLDRQPRGTPMSAADVRKLMFDCGVGIDCAGYAQSAYLYATGQTRGQAGLRSPVVEDLSNLAGRGYQRVSLADLRPGDLVVLGPQHPKDPRDVGHRVIVYDAHVATPGDMRHLLWANVAADAGVGHREPVLDSPQSRFAVGGPIRVLEVDASWGSDGDPQVGGVQRQTWFHNEGTGEWAAEVKDQAGHAGFYVFDEPYGHPLDGFYRKGS
ncbi:MAG TPA: hypothetical protein VGG39_04380 [Polyangiaceae bacterium]|jgi:hypothetical protein